MEEEKIKYKLVKLNDEAVQAARLEKNKLELDLMNAEGKLMIQKYKIEHDIPQLELNEDVEKIETTLKEIEDSKEKLDKEDSRYDEKILCRDYDILCGKEELRKAKFRTEKRMGSRAAQEVVPILEGNILLLKDNLKVAKDQVRNRVRKERIIPQQIQLDKEDKGKEDNEGTK